METRDRARERWMETREQLNASGLSRREVARIGLMTAGGALVGAGGRPAQAQSVIPEQDFPRSPPTRPFVQPMIVRQAAAPEALTPAVNPDAHQYYRRYPAQKTYRFAATQFAYSAHPDLPPSIRWGYDGQIPGPLVKARYGEPVVMRVVNDLPDLAQHRGYGIPQIVTHLHNFHSASESDGGPWDYYGRGAFKDHHYTMARAGFSAPERIPSEFVDPNGGIGAGAGGDLRETLTTLFFHDHRPDFTAPNVYRGPLGLFLIYDERDTGDETDANPLAWRLPSGPYDVPLLIQDQRYNPRTGQLFFDQFELEGHLGDKYVVNGRIQPFFEVQRRKYRFRIYTPGPARVYDLVFRADGRNVPFTQVTDVSGNLLARPRTLTRLPGPGMVPAYRVDVVVDFAALPASVTRVHLANRQVQDGGRGPDRGKFVNPDRAENQLVEFRLGAPVADPSRVPAAFRPLPPILTSGVVRREWEFGRGNGQWQINGELFDAEADHTLARLLNPRNPVRRNSQEVWVFKGGGGWEHPIHLHLEEGQAFRINGRLVPEAQRFRSDVFHMWSGARDIEVALNLRDFPDPDFNPPGGSTPGQRGRYVIHCHNTTHEDHAMMQTWNMVDA